MLQLLLWLVAVLTPEPSALLTGLSSPKFADREAAQRQLAAKLDWPLAVRLSLYPPADPETRYRARLAVQSWYRGQVWDYRRPWPYIDALNARPCEVPSAAITVRYLNATSDGDTWHRHPLKDFRTATGLLVADLRDDLVPPAMIRWLLAYMDRESAAWDARQRQRMPQSPEPPLAVVPMGP